MPQKHSHQFGGEPQLQAEKNQPKGGPFTAEAVEAYIFVMITGIAAGLVFAADKRSRNS